MAKFRLPSGKFFEYLPDYEFWIGIKHHYTKQKLILEIDIEFQIFLHVLN